MTSNNSYLKKFKTHSTVNLFEIGLILLDR